MAARLGIWTLTLLCACSPLPDKDAGPEEDGVVHRVILGYDPGDDPGPVTGNMGPLPEETRPNLRYFVIGDQGAHCDGCTLQQQVADGMASWQDGDASASGRSAHFALGTGDNFYPAGVESRNSDRFDSGFEQVYGAEIFPFLFYLVLGNHDYLGIPQAQINYHGRGSGRWYMKDRFYSFSRHITSGTDSAKVQFYALDTNQLLRDDNFFRLNGAGRYRAGERQLRWLKRQLQRHEDATWHVVLGHHSPYSTGDHGNHKILIDALVPIMEAGGVDLYFGGHDHDLQVLGRIGTDQPIAYFISGASGKARDAYLVSGSDDPAEQSNSEFVHTGGGFLWCRMTASDYAVAVCDKDGALLHLIESARP